MTLYTLNNFDGDLNAVSVLEIRHAKSRFTLRLLCECAGYEDMQELYASDGNGDLDTPALCASSNGAGSKAVMRVYTRRFS